MADRLADNPATRLASAGPLHAATQAIVERLAAVFPTGKFDHGWLPVAPSRDEWKRLVRRTPFVGLTWTGISPNPASGRRLSGRGSWRLVLVNGNTHIGARFQGDVLAPGQFGLVQVAAAALHGMTIGGTGMAGAGTVEVTDIASLSTEDFADASQAVAGLTLSVPFELTDDEALPELLRLRGAWTFDGALMEPVEGAIDYIRPGDGMLGTFLLNVDHLR